jgi:hypothetical protein
MCSETRAEYYDVLSDCRLFVTIIESLSALVHFSDQWFLDPSSGFLNLQAKNTKYLTCSTITVKGLQK